jgi:hypothetical protein
VANTTGIGICDEDWRSRARAALGAVDDPEDREKIEQDLATIPL